MKLGEAISGNCPRTLTTAKQAGFPGDCLRSMAAAILKLMGPPTVFAISMPELYKVHIWRNASILTT